MVGSRADDADSDPVAFVPAGEAINDIDSVPCIEIVDSALAIDFPDLGKVNFTHQYRSRARKSD